MDLDPTITKHSGKHNMPYSKRSWGSHGEYWGEDHRLLCGSLEVLCIVPELHTEGVERGRENSAFDEESGFVGMFGVHPYHFSSRTAMKKRS